MKKNSLSQLLITKFPLKERYGLVIFLFLLFEFVLMIKESTLDRWLLTHYLITYEFGLIPRGFVGSVVSLFTNKITYRLVYVLAVVSFTVLISQISLLLGSTLKTSESDVKPATKIFILLFLASPLSVTYLLGGYFARFDLFWVVISLLALAFLRKPALRWMVPLLCAIAVMIHQGYMVTYMPALAILLLYEVYKGKYSKGSIAIFVSSCFSMIAVFIALHFSKKNIPFDNALDYLNHLSSKATFLPEISLIFSEYYCSWQDWTLNVVLPIMSHMAPTVGLTMLVFSTPLLLIFFYVWKQSFKAAKNKFLKFIIFLCVAAPSVFVLAAISAVDWDRWWAAVLNNQFIFIFYFIFSKEKPVTDSVKNVGFFLKEHFLMLSLIIISTNFLTYSKAASSVLSIAHADLGDAGELLMILVRYVAENVPGIEKVYEILV